jgi:hypothetical protein
MTSHPSTAQRPAYPHIRCKATPAPRCDSLDVLAYSPALLRLCDIQAWLSSRPPMTPRMHGGTTGIHSHSMPGHAGPEIRQPGYPHVLACTSSLSGHTGLAILTSIWHYRTNTNLYTTASKESDTNPYTADNRLQVRTRPADLRVLVRAWPAGLRV